MSKVLREMTTPKPIHWLLPLFALCCATWVMTGSATPGQEPKKQDPSAVQWADLPAPNVKVKFHEDFRGGDPSNPNLRFMRDNIRWTAEGARITMPGGQGQLPTTGIAANFQIQGDFQITASFEVLKAEQPTEGYGVGVSLYIAIDPQAGDAVSLARRVGKKGNANYLSDRMKPNPAKGTPDHFVKTRPAKAQAGKLRVQRVGAMVRFLIADGEDGEFVPIFQDAKKRVETEFGQGEVRYFQFDGDAGRSEAALDLRLLDLTVEAEQLPGIIESPKRTATAPGVTPQALNRLPSASPLSPVMIGVSIVVLLALGASAFLLVRRRAKTRAANAK